MHIGFIMLLLVTIGILPASAHKPTIAAKRQGSKTAKHPGSNSAKKSPPVLTEMATVAVTGILVDKNHARLGKRKVVLGTRPRKQVGNTLASEVPDLTSDAGIFMFIRGNVEQNPTDPIKWYVFLNDNEYVACGPTEDFLPDTTSGSNKIIRYKTNDLIARSIVQPKNSQAEAGDILSSYYLTQQVRVSLGDISLPVANDLTTELTTQILKRTEWESPRDPAIEEIFTKISAAAKASETADPALPTLSVFAFEQFKKAADAAEVYDKKDIPPPPRHKSNSKDEAKMILIEKGRYQIGNNQYNRDDNPEHSVDLSAYYIYQYPVTVRQYSEFVKENPDHTMPLPPQKFNTNWMNLDDPIVNVTWDDALAYCKWAGGRLPTEAEWEVAAKGKKGGIYPWPSLSKDDFKPELLRSSVGEDGKPDDHGTVKVGSYPPNDLELYDMAGNVWEWCSDWYQVDWIVTELTKNPIMGDPQGPRTADITAILKSVRGGSWSNNWHAEPPKPHKEPVGKLIFSTTGRNFYGPHFANESCGFRCVIPLPKK